MKLLKRWILFNGIGLLGVAVQLSILGILVHGLGMHYLVATAIAVETTVLHNFIWHHRWTWRDRRADSVPAILARLGRFHVLNGTVSLVGNVVIMAVARGVFGVAPIPANIIAILVCSLVNFAASEVLVFRTASVAVTIVASTLALPSHARAADMAMAELTPAAIAAWQQYQRQIDERYDRVATGDHFFIEDLFKSSDWRRRAIAGQIPMLRIDSATPGGAEPSVPDARIHHWVGAVFIPNTTVDRVVRYLRDRAGRESEAFDDVVASKLIAREGDRLRVYMKLKRESVITVMYNTEHSVEYRTLGATRASSRSIATKIAELADTGTPQEHEKAAGNDHGFLWRLNAYWRFEQTDGGVVIECESVSLSRSVPMVLRPFVSGTVERIARESLQKTLTSLKAELAKALLK